MQAHRMTLCIVIVPSKKAPPSSRLGPHPVSGFVPTAAAAARSVRPQTRRITPRIAAGLVERRPTFEPP
ncbi:hypothetical protein NL676_023199 [Syzygium grande]|nr:hypothetical protein NL676_023199 [Syzygium grande]